jgi:hypothetical protein
VGGDLLVHPGDPRFGGGNGVERRAAPGGGDRGVFNGVELGLGGGGPPRFGRRVGGELGGERRDQRVVAMGGSEAVEAGDGLIERAGEKVSAIGGRAIAAIEQIGEERVVAIAAQPLGAVDFRLPAAGQRGGSALGNRRRDLPLQLVVAGAGAGAVAGGDRPQPLLGVIDVAEPGGPLDAAFAEPGFELPAALRGGGNVAGVNGETFALRLSGAAHGLDQRAATFARELERDQLAQQFAFAVADLGQPLEAAQELAQHVVFLAAEIAQRLVQGGKGLGTRNAHRAPCLTTASKSRRARE